MEAVVTILCRYIFSKRFSCEAKLRETRLTLLDLVWFQFDLSDVRRLVGELFIKAARITFTTQLGHVRRRDLSLETNDII